MLVYGGGEVFVNDERKWRGMHNTDNFLRQFYFSYRGNVTTPGEIARERNAENTEARGKLK